MSGARQWRRRAEASYGPETGTTYLLHFDEPFRHARHYTGNPESSAFLKVQLAADRWKFTELPAVLRGRPVGMACLFGGADPAGVVAVVAGYELAADAAAGPARRAAGVAGGGA